jgi:hypothetical protein
MSNGINIENTYPFYWLDEVVEVTLNPAKTSLKSLNTEILKRICERLPDEIGTITARLKNQSFCLYSSDHIRVVAGQYDQAVHLLELQAENNLKQYPKAGLLRQTGQLILDELRELARGLRKRYQSYLPDRKPKPETDSDASTGFLSADQLGILLRAAADTGILVGRSFRKVCKAFAPYLATPWRQDIQPETMRSHAGRPETTDKEIAIALLEKMISRIRAYR